MNIFGFFCLCDSQDSFSSVGDTASLLALLAKMIHNEKSWGNLLWIWMSWCFLCKEVKCVSLLSFSLLRRRRSLMMLIHNTNRNRRRMRRALAQNYSNQITENFLGQRNVLNANQVNKFVARGWVEGVFPQMIRAWKSVTQINNFSIVEGKTFTMPCVELRRGWFTQLYVSTRGAVGMEASMKAKRLGEMSAGALLHSGYGWWTFFALPFSAWEIEVGKMGFSCWFQLRARNVDVLRALCMHLCVWVRACYNRKMNE